MKPLQTLLPFKVIVERDAGAVTAYAGLPLIIEAFRAVTSKAFFRTLRDALGYKSWRAVRRHLESIVLLVAAGGDCLDDLRMMRGDPGLRHLLGFLPSSPTQAKEFLYRFHQDRHGKRWNAQRDAELSREGIAQIREEGPGLKGLEALVQETVRRVQHRRPNTRATLDVDATIIEAHKRSALRAYEGTVGYQPQLAWWAEHAMWVKDEFRDGNVPAAYGVLEFLQVAFMSLPGSVVERRLRADSALYDERALSWADDAKIQFAVSADMSQELRTHVLAIAQKAWRPYRTLKRDEPQDPDRTEEREWADVQDFIPDWERNRRNGTRPFRYLAIRVRPRQRELWEESNGWRHFAIVTNMDWDGERLLHWQREKQGTVEHAHGVLKNELAAGTLPSGRFGANAAFLRINVVTQNLLELMKVVALPQDMATLRPKALRFRVFQLAGRIIHHGRSMVLKITDSLPFARFYDYARHALAAFAASALPAPS